MSDADLKLAHSAGLPADQAHTVTQASLTGPWQQVRGRTREWWSRLTEGDLDRTRQFQGFIGQLQARYGFSRKRAAMLLRRRMLKHRASQAQRD